jgi:hypothetical protein
MSDLRVTDVQAALRHLADVGHDIISDPYKLKLHGKEYQSLASKLNIRKITSGKPASGGKPFDVYHLSSHIDNGESPVISRIGTGANNLDGGEIIERGVYFHTPEVHYTGENHHSSWSLQTDSGKNGNWIKDHPSGYWLPNKDGSFTGRAYGVSKNMVNHIKGTHDMIAQHARGDIPERGHFIDSSPGGSGKRELLTPETFRHFDNIAATEALTNPLPPRYSSQTPNLVHVTVRDDNNYSKLSSSHIYNPDTEQLIKVEH